MTEDEFKSKAKQVKGKMDETAGKITGDKGKELKGKMEQTGGKAQEQISQLKKKVQGYVKTGYNRA